MMEPEKPDHTDHEVSQSRPAPQKILSPAAERALAEAEERRRQATDAGPAAAELPKEINGRGGQDPVRYGDWEVKGLASDF